MNYEDRLVKIMTDKGVKNKDLIRACKVSNGAISQWRHGLSRPKNIFCLAKALGVDSEKLKNYLERGIPIDDDTCVQEAGGAYDANVDEIDSNLMKMVPVIDMVAAGDWRECADPYEVGGGESWEHCPVQSGENTFAVRITGESMMPRFRHGEIIFCDPSKEAFNGDFVIAKLTDENQATFKQLVIEDGKRMLKALNPNWPQQYILINGNCHIVGKIIARIERF